MKAAPAMVVRFDSFEDGSGAPASLACGEYRAAFDCVGNGAKMLRIDGPTSWRPRGARTAAIARMTAAYRARLAQLGADWLERNRAMYAL